MRLLPRTAKGTWLLAAAAWAAGCTAVWELLPPMPRASWALPEPSELAFLRGGSELVTRTLRFYPCGDFIGQPPPREPDGPVRVWDPKSGLMNRSFAPADPDAPKFEPPLPDQPPETKFEAVSGDWHVLATSFSVAGTVREISVWEAGSLRRISTLPLPPGIQYVVCRLNTTGTIVAAALTNADNKDAGAICWQSATGRELFKIPDASRVIVSKDGNTLLTFSERIPSISLDDVEYRLSAWDVHTARKRFTIDLACRGFYLDRDAPMISPDDRIIAAPTGRGPVDPFGNLARRLGMRWPYRELSTGETMTLFDLASGREIGRVAGEFQWSRWSPDGTLLATLDDGRHVVRVWDIPPRKPLSWFALAAGVLALPPAWLARRRVRRLRSPAHL